MKFLMVFLLIILGILLLLIFYSYFIAKKPIIGTISTIYFRLVKFNKIFKKGNFEREFKNRKISPEKIFPYVKTKNKLSSHIIDHNYVFELSPRKKYSKIIVYLHGGAFFNEITKYHVKYLDKLVTKTGYKVVIPCYSVVTKGTWKDAFNLMDAVYANVFSLGIPVIFMGDSAGGGLCLSYTQYLIKQKKTLPSKLVMLSPWLDIGMSNKETKKYAKIDPVLNLHGLKLISRIWSAEIGTKDYRVSPLFGNYKYLPSCFIAFGDQELCYPDNKLFVDNMIAENKDIKYIIGKGMNHIFPLYPIPDYYHVRKEIVKFIKKDGGDKR